MGANPFKVCDIIIKSYILNSYRFFGYFTLLGLNKIPWRQSQAAGLKYLKWRKGRFSWRFLDKIFKNNTLIKIRHGF
jgi:hypothetical protein